MIHISNIIAIYILFSLLFLLILWFFTSVKINLIAHIIIGISILLLGFKEENKILMAILIVVGLTTIVYHLVMMFPKKKLDSSISNPASW
jgi:hypothetical protein